MRLIVVVGTSLFSTYNDRFEMYRKYPEMSKDYESIESQCKCLDKLFAIDRNNSKYASDIRHIQDYMNMLYYPFAKWDACNELKIINSVSGVLEVVLVATDSVLSVVACELIKEWLKGTGIRCTFNDNLSSSDTTIAKGICKEKISFENLDTILGRYLDSGTKIVCSTFDTVQIYISRKYDNPILCIHEGLLYEL